LRRRGHGHSGRRDAETVRARRPALDEDDQTRLKALFISGHAPESARLTEVLDDAGRAFLPKPFPARRAGAKVREILDAAE
jgi:hypothetical protein